MKNYYLHLKIFGLRFLLLLFLFELSRLFFFILNYSYFSDIGFFEAIKVFFLGLQYDIYVIFIFNIIFIILSLIPGAFKLNKHYQLSLKILFFLVNSILLLVNYIDAEYFRFNFKRSTADIIDFLNAGGGETGNLLPVFLRDFWYIILTWLILMVGAWMVYPRIRSIKKNYYRSQVKKKIRDYSLQILILIVTLGVLFTISRGIRLQPLNVISPAKYTDVKYIPLVLNTPFTILRTYNMDDLELKDYFPEDQVYDYYSPIKKYQSDKDFNEQNVVIIILESFSEEYIGFLRKERGVENTYTPFIDSLCKNSLVFKNGFANGKRSIEALPAIFAGIPTLMNNAYVSSQYSVNKINSLASILSKKGYHSAFFHGGKNGTMGFDDFTSIAGFKEYYGLSEYPEKDHFDGNWGIYDEEYLQYYAEMLDGFEQPFMSSIFTLSSHHPYSVPEKHEGKFKDGPVKITKVIEYGDYALKRFFETASKMDWYDSTLFVIIADHTGQAINDHYYKQVGNFRIPIIFFHPSDSSLTGISDTIAQQLDIMPTVLSYLNYSGDFICFGTDLFNHKEEHFALMYINDFYQIIKDGYVYVSDGEDCLAYYDLNDRALKNNYFKEDLPTIKSTEIFLKALIQIYNKRMINNNMTLE